jgi:hypothetical protein
MKRTTAQTPAIQIMEILLIFLYYNPKVLKSGSGVDVSSAGEGTGVSHHSTWVVEEGAGEADGETEGEAV